jgi:murein DD-endopeptidase MepM/ murein hydrolase activator NlpD
MRRPWWLLVFLLIAIPCSGEEAITVSWSPQEVRQGDILFVTVTPAGKIATVEGDLDGTTIYFYEQGGGVLAGIVGVDLASLPGEHRLRVLIKAPEGRSFEQAFQVLVHAGEFEVQRLSVSGEMVDFTEEIYQRYLAERKEIKRVFNQVRMQRLWHHPFIRPVEGEITSAFGLRRILNDQERSPHNGVDIRAPEGTEVCACNDGIVVFAQELYLEGKTIIMDHGFGLYSIYMHLSEMRVKEGEAVGIGDCIGLVGATGRVTGPHLHWGVKLLGARVNPYSLLMAVPPGE